MKRVFLSIFAVLSFFALASFAEEFKDSGAVFSVDFPAGWKTGKSDDPTVVLKLERGKSFVDFAKLDSELSDYYLKVRVKEQVESLRSKGITLLGDTRPVGLHGVSNAYYTNYSSMDTQVYIAFFTYNGGSFAISASGLSDGEFKGIVSTIRKPGEKIELPKPPKIKKIRIAKKPKEDVFPGFEISTGAESAASTAAVDASTAAEPAAVAQPVQGGETNPVIFEPAPVSTGPSVGERAVQLVGDFFTKLEQRQNASIDPPYIQRRPVSFFVWLVLIGLWIGGAVWARGEAAKFQNPKLPPPPKDVPPDFFFPFLISRRGTAKEATYNVQNRQKQLLLASFNFEHEIYVAGSVYGALVFHIFWSVMELAGKGGRVTGLLFALPGGRLWASMPEIFFIIPLVAGLCMYLNKKQLLQIFDAQSNLVMAAKKEVAYCLIRDGKGKEVARLVRKTGTKERGWDFVDTDNQVVFTIKDDHPRGYLMRKLFGCQGGALRSHYGIFAAERRAGFVFLDPTSANKFQIHLDFSFARLANPAQMLASVLYIISKEKDPVYPSPF
ncbi:MAG: hypothetical protein HY796_04655 [Elusimicrobia bacterium]|nr:hypothetical protein [Elusimicrobiota bacterium]